MFHEFSHTNPRMGKKKNEKEYTRPLTCDIELKSHVNTKILAYTAPAAKINQTRKYQSMCSHAPNIKYAFGFLFPVKVINRKED
uniref:Uncharacterized protein n=1 Tax=Rhizophora mucronata TaxID=61149 RepID=A0A2P2MDG9_RHIMU